MKGFTVWITGLPSSGKTTIGKQIAHRIGAILIDGDQFRKSISKDLGFSAADRKENVLRAARTARFMNDLGKNVVACFISPYEAVRQEIRDEFEDRFVLVYAKCPVEECIKRDVKGLYKKALAKEIPDFTGVSAPYEEPVSVNFIVDTMQETPEESVANILNFLQRGNLWKMKATLFIGRWSPPHKGHKYLFDSVLNNGGSIVIGVRDTPIDEQNPYSAGERLHMLEAMYPPDQYPYVKVIIIPDVDMVCVGRKVGYKIMSVPPEIESISASKFREKNETSYVTDEVLEIINQKKAVSNISEFEQKYLPETYKKLLEGKGDTS